MFSTQSQRRRGATRGLTLVELAIVIVIFGILAGIAIPIYVGLAEDAKWAEGRTMMSTVRTHVRMAIELNNGIGDINGGTPATNIAWADFGAAIRLDEVVFSDMRYFGVDNFELDIAGTTQSDIVYTIRLGGGGSGIGTERPGIPRGTLELSQDGEFNVIN